MSKSDKRSGKSVKRLELLCAELNDNKKQWIPVGVIKHIYVYPLMSCKPIEVTSCEINQYSIISSQNEFIFQNNMFVIYDASTNCIIQDHCNFRLNSLEIKPVDEYIIKLAVEGMHDLVLDMQDIQERRILVSNMSVFHKKFLVEIKCIDCGKEAAEWISSYLGIPNARLGYNVPRRKSPKPFLHKYNISEENCLNTKISYGNIPNCQILSEKSLVNVNSKIDQFRASIVFEPFSSTRFTELRWDWISIGNAIVRNIIPWS